MRSIPELAERVRLASRVQTHPFGSRFLEGSPVAWDFSALPTVLTAYPADQVVTVSTHLSLDEIQSELSRTGQWIPFVPGVATGLLDHASLRGFLDTRLPHPAVGTFGSWRDWVLGATVVLASGEVVKSGCRAVKNVAGFDLHKLVLGARGKLGIITEVHLRTWPLASRVEGESRTAPQDLWVAQCPFSRVAAWREALGDRCLEHDALSGQFWGTGDLPPGADWVWHEGQPLPEDRWTRRTLELFDPTGKLN